MYDATPISYEDYSPDDKPLVALIKTKDLWSNTSAHTHTPCIHTVTVPAFKMSQSDQYLFPENRFKQWKKHFWNLYILPL